MAEEIVNKVAKSPLQQVDLEDWMPQGMIEFDIAPFLYKGLVLKEKEFRSAIKETDWSQFADQNIAVFCSEDAIVQPWAYMLVTSSLLKVDAKPFFGTLEEAKERYISQKIENLDPEVYSDAKLVIKGCSQVQNLEALLMQLTQKIQPYAKSIMFGEACSTVPIFKAKNK